MQDIFEACERPEQKLRVALDAMRSSLSQEEGPPQFKDFWELRKLCIPLFQEGIHPAVRSQFWEELSALSKEARSLKQLLSEEAAFAVEQIEAAIGALEEQLNAHRGVSPKEEMKILNALAASITALRKQLMGTETRFKTKNQLFSRLSELGENVFPRRKELIAATSAAFSKEVDQFVAKHFQGGEARGATTQLRTQIRILQQRAKELPLNSETFSKVREKLSDCWEAIKGVKTHKEIFREFAEKVDACEEMGQLEELERSIPELGDLELSKARERIARQRSMLESKAEEKWIETASYDELIERQGVVRAELAACRQAKGGSGMDIEQAMQFDVLVKDCKARLERIERAIARSL